MAEPKRYYHKTLRGVSLDEVNASLSVNQTNQATPKQVEQIELEPGMQTENRGLPVQAFSDIKVGAGDTNFRVNKQGMWLGDEVFSSAEFRVSPSGALTCTGATITGSMTATSGTIGGWAITSDTVIKTDGNSYIVLDSNPMRIMFCDSYGYNRLIIGDDGY